MYLTQAVRILQSLPIHSPGFSTRRELGGKKTQTIAARTSVVAFTVVTSRMIT